MRRVQDLLSALYKAYVSEESRIDVLCLPKTGGRFSMFGKPFPNRTEKIDLERSRRTNLGVLYRP